MSDRITKIFEKKENTINFLKNSKFPIVIKADGLAAGKGVYISENLSEATEAVNEVFDTTESVTKFKRSETPAPHQTAVTEEPEGIPAKVLFSGLGLGLILLVGVIFVLPGLIEQDSAVMNYEDPNSDGQIEFTEEVDTPGTFNGVDLDSQDSSDLVGVKAATDESLGDLLSQLERLRYRAIDRWGGQPYLDAVDVYKQGDEAYISRDYLLAGDRYRQASGMLRPFFEQMEAVFKQSMTDGKEALERADASEAVRLFDLAVSVTPGNRLAEANLKRAMNLDSVLILIDRGVEFETNLELDAAKLAFEKALEIDPMWQPAAIAIDRVADKIKVLAFEQRMTEAFEALVSEDFGTARAAFNAAKILYPNSREPTDGLLQLEQEERLSDIRRLEKDVQALTSIEQWENAINVYENILKIDPNLTFAQQGLDKARSYTALHRKLGEYINDPDKLSDAGHMEGAAKLLLEIAIIEEIGNRLQGEKNELSRLLKRAATTVPVKVVSDRNTEVSVYRVGRFGTFSNMELQLRPGNYVAIGVRAGYRDVRIEFRVAPEIDMQPIVVKCEEAI